MKFEKVKQFKTIGTAVSLALLLAAGNVSAGNGNGNGKSNSPNNGDTFGASVGVSSTCALVDDGKTFQVTTTITDKSSGDTIPSFPADGSYVDYIGKLRGPKIPGVSPYVVATDPFNPNEVPVGGDAIEGVVTNTLDLCTAGLMVGTVSLNSSTTVVVSNSKGGTYYTSQCVATDDYPKVVIDVGILDDNCPE